MTMPSHVSLKSDDPEPPSSMSTSDQAAMDRMSTIIASMDNEDVQVPMQRSSNISASGHAYSWSQSAQTVEIMLELKASYTAKVLKVDIKPFILTVRHISDGELLSGSLTNRIRPEQSEWAIIRDSGTVTLTIYLEKYVKRADWPLWKTLFEC